MLAGVSPDQIKITWVSDPITAATTTRRRNLFSSGATVEAEMHIAIRIVDMPRRRRSGIAGRLMAHRVRLLRVNRWTSHNTTVTRRRRRPLEKMDA